MLLKCFQNVERKFRGIRVHEPYPLELLHRSQRVKQWRECSFAVQIESIIGRVLTDDDEFFHAFPYKPHHLIHDLLDWLWTMPTPHHRNGTKWTWIVAPLRYFHVGRIGVRKERTLSEQLIFVVTPEFIDDLRDVIRPKEPVHFGYLVDKVVVITLWQTAHDDHFLELPLILQPNGLENCFYRLPFCLIDEAARVNNSYWGVGNVGGNLQTIPLQLAQEGLRIDLILGTAKCYDVDLFGRHTHGRFSISTSYDSTTKSI